MRTVLAAAAGIAIAMAASAGSAQTVYPIDRADILSGARFDFKSNLQASPIRQRSRSP
jgi:hypothetical protein